MISRLSLLFLGGCWSSAKPAPSPRIEPVREPIEDWARTLATTHISSTIAYRSDGTVSFTLNLSREPDHTRDVTIVPIDPALAPKPGRIAEIVQRVDPVDEVSPLWLVEIESRDASYLAAQAPMGRRNEYPFDAVLIVPARKAARLVAAPDALPPDLSRKDIRAALDLDDDGTADVIVWEQPIKEDYSQGGTYARTPTGWKSIHAWMPL
jgi:hypothetical protein